MATWAVIEFRKIPSLAPARRGQMDSMIVYTVDGKRDQTYVTIVPSATPTDAEISTAIRTDLQHRQTMLGKTGTV